METTTTTTQLSSHLPQLLYEILVLIINQFLVQDEPLILHTKRGNRSVDLHATYYYTPLLSILLVSRFFYTVGLEAFYGRNTLRFTDDIHTRRFVTELATTEQIRRITEIEITLWWEPSRRRGLPALTLEGGSSWRLVRNAECWSEWQRAAEQLQALKRITIRSVTQFDQEEMVRAVDRRAFEERMRREMGEQMSALTRFEWPLQ